MLLSTPESSSLSISDELPVSVSSQVKKEAAHDMPDIANERQAQVRGTLDRVGMQDVELPILIERSKGVFMSTPARAHLYVNLSDPDSKGIHMSRLYRIAMEHMEQEPMSFALLEKVLKAFMKSHEDISTTAKIELRYEYMTKRPSLKSGLEGWRSYPVHMSAETKVLDGQISVERELEVEVVYSSTCPCSASLARQLIQNRFKECFPDAAAIDRETMLDWLSREDSICATPHSQRSTAKVRIKAPDSYEPMTLVDRAEEALKTPVQAMVKREDEQEFALLNGQNLMFCEDAARRLKRSLEEAQVEDFRCEVQHYESLHPHDAVAIVVKGIDGGFKA